jgi:hypothetical protein
MQARATPLCQQSAASAAPNSKHQQRNGQHEHWTGTHPSGFLYREVCAVLCAHVQLLRASLFRFGCRQHVLCMCEDVRRKSKRSKLGALHGKGLQGAGSTGFTHRQGWLGRARLRIVFLNKSIRISSCWMGGGGQQNKLGQPPPPPPGPPLRSKSRSSSPPRPSECAGPRAARPTPQSPKPSWRLRSRRERGAAPGRGCPPRAPPHHRPLCSSGIFLNASLERKKGILRHLGLHLLTVSAFLLKHCANRRRPCQADAPVRKVPERVQYLLDEDQPVRRYGSEEQWIHCRFVCCCIELRASGYYSMQDETSGQYAGIMVHVQVSTNVCTMYRGAHREDDHILPEL